MGTMTSASTAEDDAPTSGMGRRVLIVEDEVRLARLLGEALRRAGYGVDIAHDGVGGLRLAKAGGHDVVILDIMLPGLSGYRVLQALRADGHDVPVVMLTAKDGEYDQAEALDTGADDYLTKPFSFVVLLARLRALMRRSGRSERVIHQAGDLSLDPATHRCTRGDVDVTLTAREFAVLEFLIRRRGEVVSKAEILDNVWDFAFDGDPNIVEVYVGRLRRKVDEPFGQSSLETVRGAGYRLAEADG